MKIFLSPQLVTHEDRFEYSFNGEIITVTFKGKTDVFDFTQMPLGETNAVAPRETILEVYPLLYAQRTSEGLFVKLLNYIGSNATEQEKFPEWSDV